MGKALVIVESPAKAKTINKYLGENYVVKSSIGHIRDLPSSSSSKKNKININKIKKKQGDLKNSLIKRMGIDPYNGWKAQYEILPGKEKIVTELKMLAKKSNHIYLATDLDREGEAIAWHLQEVIGGNNTRFSRVVFNEITKNKIFQAFKNPSTLNFNRVNAQQTRRFMDRIVGYMISPLLWNKIARGLSAGRVQSVAVRLIVERERNIKSFIPEEYWELRVLLKTFQNSFFIMQVTHYREKFFKPVNNQQIKSILELLKNAHYKVIDRNQRLFIKKPVLPFITSTLQQAASIILGYSIKKTMKLAQLLYESGYITYMRTDSTNLSQDSINMARCYISNSFGDDYLPKKINTYISKHHSQEAHEAIRPSNVNVLSEHLIDIESDTKNLYRLIWRQFVACQMKSAQYNLTTLTVISGDFQLRTRVRTLFFDGWTKIIPILNNNELLISSIINEVKVGDILEMTKLIPTQHFTKPPARYSEASLVKELEKRGIGRPSTYVSIISTIQDRGYVHIKNHRFYAEKIGEIVTDSLKENFCELMSYNFTAKMENILDQIATNNQEWKSVLDAFFKKFIQNLEIAKKNPESGGMRVNYMVITNINCLVCGRKMGIRTATTGVFLGCEGYLLPLKERCKNTINLIPELEILNILEGNNAETHALRARLRCRKCSTAMDSYIIDEQRKMYICGNNPLCNGYDIKQEKFKIKGYDGLVIQCEKCSSDMQLKLGRFGKYMACINSSCKNTRKILRNGFISPPKENPVPLFELTCKNSNSYFVLRHSSNTGVFLAANTFPKSRETRAPLVEELSRFRDRLPKNLHYLADAPIKDDEGNKTLVRFSRKTKEQYISSENKGKVTSWTAFYINGTWKVIKK